MSNVLKQHSIDLNGNKLDLFYTNVSRSQLSGKYSYRINDIEVFTSNQLLENDFTVRKLSIKDLFWMNLYDFEDFIGRIAMLIAIPVVGILFLSLVIILFKAALFGAINVA